MGFTPDENNASIFSQPRAAVKPMEGDLLLWESHVRHGYSENHSPNRMSLSINMIPRIVFSHRYGFVVKPLEEELNGITTEADKETQHTRTTKYRFCYRTYSRVTKTE